MRKSFGVKPCMYPMPVLILGSYDENGNANAMNAAWGGIIDSDKIIISISGGHKTTKNIHKTNAFSVSFATRSTLTACDSLDALMLVEIVCEGNVSKGDIISITSLASSSLAIAT